MKKISIIVPVYKVEDYLCRCIDSVLAQTMKDFELIIVNDCSKDSTEKIIKSYTDPRIRYFKNKENLKISKTICVCQKRIIFNYRVK